MFPGRRGALSLESCVMCPLSYISSHTACCVAWGSRVTCCLLCTMSAQSTRYATRHQHIRVTACCYHQHTPCTHNRKNSLPSQPASEHLHYIVMISCAQCIAAATLILDTANTSLVGICTHDCTVAVPPMGVKASMRQPPHGSQVACRMILTWQSFMLFNISYKSLACNRECSLPSCRSIFGICVFWFILFLGNCVFF